MKIVYKSSYRKSDRLRPHIFRVHKPHLFWTIEEKVRLNDMQTWCANNLRAKHPAHPRAKGWLFEPFRLRFAIATEDDAFAFKMRWC